MERQNLLKRQECGNLIENERKKGTRSHGQECGNLIENERKKGTRSHDGLQCGKAE